jgi:hypothetical protein
MNQQTKRTGLILMTALLTALGSQTGFADDHYRHGVHRYGERYEHRYYQPRPHYRRHNSNDDEKLIYGLLVGGLFGYVIGNAYQDNYPRQQYVPPAPPPRAYQPRPDPASACLQEREYQMTVIVGGKEAQAYGTACLQPDGSWYRGPAKVVSR